MNSKRLIDTNAKNTTRHHKIGLFWASWKTPADVLFVRDKKERFFVESCQKSGVVCGTLEGCGLFSVCTQANNSSKISLNSRLYLFAILAILNAQKF
jgi:hypothetical protein